MPIFAPFLGTIIGVMIYQLMVGFHVEGEVRDKQEEAEENVRLTNVTANDNPKEGTKEMQWACSETFSGTTEHKHIL